MWTKAKKKVFVQGRFVRCSECDLADGKRRKTTFRFVSTAENPAIFSKIVVHLETEYFVTDVGGKTFQVVLVADDLGRKTQVGIRSNRRRDLARRQTNRRHRTKGSIATNKNSKHSKLYRG